MFRKHSELPPEFTTRDESFEYERQALAEDFEGLFDGWITYGRNNRVSYGLIFLFEGRPRYSYVTDWFIYDHVNSQDPRTTVLVYGSLARVYSAVTWRYMYGLILTSRRPEDRIDMIVKIVPYTTALSGEAHPDCFNAFSTKAYNSRFSVLPSDEELAEAKKVLAVAKHSLFV